MSRVRAPSFTPRGSRERPESLGPFFFARAHRQSCSPNLLGWKHAQDHGPDGCAQHHCARIPLGHPGLERPGQPDVLRVVRVPHLLRLHTRRSGTADAASSPRRKIGRRDRDPRRDGAPRGSHARLRAVGDPRQGGRMRRFERKPDGMLEAQLDAEEAVLLQSLAGQVAELVAESALRQAQGVSTSSTSESDSTSSTSESDSTSSTSESDSTSSTSESDSTSSTSESDSTSSSSESDSTSSTSDAAVARLLPNAYPDDPEASAEFRRFTQSGLAERKVGNAETVIRSLAGAGATGSVTLDDSEALSWLRSLTDIRLTIASRLGIESEDDDAGRSIDPLMREIYDWLGFVQNSLIEALDNHAAHG